MMRRGIQQRASRTTRPRFDHASVTDSKSADLNDVAEVLTLRNHTASEGGGIGRRAGFRFQCPLDVQVRVLSLAPSANNMRSRTTPS